MLNTNCHVRTVVIEIVKSVQTNLCSSNFKYAEFECLGNNLYKHCDFLSFLKPTGCLFLLVKGSSGYLKFGAWGF